MAEFDIRYSETYARTYSVEADSFEAAKTKLYDLITEGAVEGPDCCIDSEYKDVTVRPSAGSSSVRMGRVVKVLYEDQIGSKKFSRQNKFDYKGYDVFQEKTPSGYLVSQSWMIVKDEGETPLVILIGSFNNISLYEVVDAIDWNEMDGKFGFKAFERGIILNGTHLRAYVVHSCGDMEI